LNLSSPLWHAACHRGFAFAHDQRNILTAGKVSDKNK
jgi:hypothetical protein